MADRLKIYACSGVGDVKLPTVTFDNYGLKTTDNTQAVNTILIAMNSCRVRMENLEMSDSEREQYKQLLEVYKKCLQAAKSGKSDEELSRAGMEIAEEYGLGSDFEDWWKNTIVPRNKVGLPETARKMVRQGVAKAKAIKGIGELDWHDNEELTEYLTKGSEYFLYTYFTDAQLRKLPSIFAIKKRKQMNTYNYCKALFVGAYGSEAEMRRVIEDGIIQYFGHTPKGVCEKIASGENPNEKVGVIIWTVQGIVAIVMACLSFLASVIVAICQAVAQSKAAQYAAINKQMVEESIPNPDDWDDTNFGGDASMKKLSGWLPFLAIGAGLLLLFKK